MPKNLKSTRKGAFVIYTPPHTLAFWIEDKRVRAPLSRSLRLARVGRVLYHPNTTHPTPAPPQTKPTPNATQYKTHPSATQSTPTPPCSRVRRAMIAVRVPRPYRGSAFPVPSRRVPRHRHGGAGNYFGIYLLYTHAISLPCYILPPCLNLRAFPPASVPCRFAPMARRQGKSRFGLAIFRAY